MLTRWTSWTLLTAVLVSAAGCSGNRTPSPEGREGASAAALASSPGDVDEDSADPNAAATQTLLRTLIDRDDALLEMSRMAVTRKEQLQVSDDARRILGETRQESNRLLAVLKGEFRTTHKPTMGAADQTMIDSLNGVGAGEFDRAFLGIVARHVEEDAAIIEKALPDIAPALRESMSAIRVRRVTEAEALKKQLIRTPVLRR